MVSFQILTKRFNAQARLWRKKRKKSNVLSLIGLKNPYQQISLSLTDTFNRFLLFPLANIFFLMSICSGKRPGNGIRHFQAICLIEIYSLLQINIILFAINKEDIYIL